jgi:alcohol dehydrogenase, propanol-preferring
MPGTMRAVQVSHPGGNFEVVERAIPEAAREELRLKIEACGICHSDAIVKDGRSPFGGLQDPRFAGTRDCAPH